MWSGTISFGLVSIPVTLWPAVREGRVNMRMLTREGHPLGRRYYSQNTDREIHPEHLIRGYRISDDKFIPITEEELESLAPEKSRDIDLRRFVDRNSIDPMYFERAHFLLPAEGSNKAYRLLAETMEKTSRAGIATFVMRETEYLVAILSDKGILRAEVMRFPDELRKPQDIGLPELGKAEKSQVTKFEHAIQASTGRFKPSLLEDRQKEKLLKLIEQKDKHHKIASRASAPCLFGGSVAVHEVIHHLLH
jgi:DNA end-binding protein Ku